MHTKHDEKPKQRTRRQWRRDRPVLEVGAMGVEGVVKRLFREKRYGYIQPKNNAARIRFDLLDVPYARLKCVEEGRTVFFTVAKGASGRLKAIVT
jgi:cold shock CspA family protein